MESSKDIICRVTPLDIGIETAGGVNTVLIPRGTALPAKRSQVFSTAHDGQSAVIVNISQGNRPMFSDNILVGRFSLNGIPSAPRGVLQEEVTVSVDENGVISVTARDLGTGREEHAAIASSSELSEDEIERARHDAEMNAEDDRLRAELANVKNSAEALCFAIEKSLEENSSKVLDDENQGCIKTSQ